MKKLFMTRTISLILAVVTLLSLAAIGITTATAESDMLVKYFVNIYFAEGYGDTTGDILFTPICGDTKLNGIAAKTYRLVGEPVKLKFTDKYVPGGITGGTIRFYGNDNAYVEKIEVSSSAQPEVVTIYGGRWVFNEDETTFNINDDVYKVTVKTSNDVYSGTDLIISSKLYTTNGRSILYLNNLRDGDLFEQGSEHSFYIGTSTLGMTTADGTLISEDVNGQNGTFEKIGFELNKSGYDIVTPAASAWLLESVKVEKVQGIIKESPMTINANQWYDKDDCSFYSNQNGKTSTFKVEVQTTNSSKAGTDANLSLSINDCEETISLNHFADLYHYGNKFEKGNNDKFQIAYPSYSLNECVKSITIHNDGFGAGPDWYLGYIKLTEILSDGTEGKTYTFPCNGWINNDETVTLTETYMIRH